MTTDEAKQHLLVMLESLTPGSILHVLAEILRDSEIARVGVLDEVARERLKLAEGFLFTGGCGLDAVMHR